MKQYYIAQHVKVRGYWTCTVHAERAIRTPSAMNSEQGIPWVVNGSHDPTSGANTCRSEAPLLLTYCSSTRRGGALRSCSLIPAGTRAREGCGRKERSALHYSNIPAEAL